MASAGYHRGSGMQSDRDAPPGVRRHPACFRGRGARRGVSLVDPGASATEGPDLAADALPRLLAVLAAADVTVSAANALRPTLDDVFLSLTGRSLRESAAAAPASEES